MTLSDLNPGGQTMVSSFEHRDYRDSVRAFLSRRIIPEYQAWREQGSFPREILIQAAEDGFVGTAVPEQFGGLGIDDRRFGAIVAAEAMRAGVTDLALMLALHNDVVVPALNRSASEELRARWLPGMASGEILAAVVFGPSVVADGATAVIDGRAEFVVTGADADVLLVIGEDAIALIEPGATGVGVSRSPVGIGLDAAGFADISFDGSHGVTLGENATTLVATDLHLVTAITAAAGADGALDLTVAYVRDRNVFGVPLGSLQNSRRVLAEAAALVQSAVTLADVCLADRLEDRLDGARAAAAAEHAVSAYRTVVDTGVQLHGGYGYIMEYGIAHAYTDAQFWDVHAGGAAARHEAIAAGLLG